MSVGPNAPAYPCRPSEAHKGLTIRQAYAMAAMQGLSASDSHSYSPACEISRFAFDQADAMIAHENGGGE
jgi:hypothetical protein